MAAAQKKGKIHKVKGEGVLGGYELSRVWEQNFNSHHGISYVLIYSSRGGCQWRKEPGSLGSTVIQPIAFIEHLLYVMHYPMCLGHTPSFSPHNDPGKQVPLSSLTGKESETKGN